MSNSNVVFDGVTPVGDIVFMAAARPMQNDKGKDEYSLKLRFDSTSEDAQAFADMLRKYDSRKVDTAHNKATGELVVNFKTGFQPGVVDGEGNDMEAPFFDGRNDSGQAQAQIIIKKLDTPIQSTTHVVYLTGIALSNLELAEREDQGSNTGTAKLVEKLQKLSAE